MSTTEIERAEPELGAVRVVLALITMGLMVSALWIKSSLAVWLVLEAAVFIPVERVLALRKPQKIFRRHWRTDIVYNFVTATLVNGLLAAIIAAVYAFCHWLVPNFVFDAISSQPGLVQFAEAVLLAEFCGYWAHRINHQNRFMWKFHALHHSIEEMDWLAAARVHPVDQVFSRSIVLIPMTVLFPKGTLAVYLILTGFQSFFNHSNVKVTFGPLRYLISTPEFHHWHHANQKEAYDTNYSGQFPWLDAMFGTLHLPEGRRPEKFGIGDQPPDGYLRQLAWSFTYAPWKKKRKAAPPANPEAPPAAAA